MGRIPPRTIRRARVGLILTLGIWTFGASSPAAAPSATAAPTSLSAQPAPSPLSPPELTVPAAVLQDLDSGQVLFQKATHGRRPIASLTKIMTALIVLERAPLEEMVTVSMAAASESGAEVGLAAGETITVRNLLYAMLLQSANDAAVALADHVAGSESAFASLMNRHAEDLGLRDTFFFGSTGLDDRGYSTAADVATLTREAYEYGAFARIVRTRFHTIPGPDGAGRLVQNRNVLLFRYPGAIGVKTGMTTASGHCLSAVAERNDVRLLAVALGHPSLSYDDGAALLDYGFGAFRTMLLVEEGEQVGTVDVEGRRVSVVAREDLAWLVAVGAVPVVELRLRPKGGLTLPIEAGDLVGQLAVRVDGRRVALLPAVASSTPAEQEPSLPEPPEVVASPLGEAVNFLRVFVEELIGAFL